MFKREETVKWRVEKRIGDLDEFIEERKITMQRRFT